MELVMYDAWLIIKLVISCGPNPGLISCTAFGKPSPAIPPRIVVELIVIRIRKIPYKQHCFPFHRVHFVMGKCDIRIICLTKIPFTKQTQIFKLIKASRQA